MRFCQELKRARLKEICRALEFDDAGREKADMVAQLVDTSSPSACVVRCWRW